MNVKVIALPELLQDDEARRSVIVVFDVLRATSSMVTALRSGAAEIRVFETIDECRVEAARFPKPRLLAGERDCLPPPGFDCGNSPREFTRERCEGRTVFMSTTNGTRALLAARSGARVLVAALLNAGATARVLLTQTRDVLLLCAGTRGEIATEDLLGAAAVLDAMGRRTGGDARVEPGNDAASIALSLFEQWRGSLAERLAATAGGRHVIAAGLSSDIDHVARVDAIPVVAEVCDGRIVRRRDAV